MSHRNDRKKIESKLDVQTFLDRLTYAIQSGRAKINFQKDRNVDLVRDLRFSNRYTMSKLFPDEDEVKVLKRELLLLNVDDYIETVTDLRFPNKSDMRVFGKQYMSEDVYIKIRVELISYNHAFCESFIFVMSFHYSDKGIMESDFPYGKG